MAYWQQRAVTDIGNEMLNDLMAGRKMTICSAWSGTEKAAEDELAGAGKDPGGQQGNGDPGHACPAAADRNADPQAHPGLTDVIKRVLDQALAEAGSGNLSLPARTPLPNPASATLTPRRKRSTSVSGRMKKEITCGW